MRGDVDDSAEPRAAIPSMTRWMSSIGVTMFIVTPRQQRLPIQLAKIAERRPAVVVHQNVRCRARRRAAPPGPRGSRRPRAPASPRLRSSWRISSARRLEHACDCAPLMTTETPASASASAHPCRDPDSMRKRSPCDRESRDPYASPVELDVLPRPAHPLNRSGRGYEALLLRRADAPPTASRSRPSRPSSACLQTAAPSSTAPAISPRRGACTRRSLAANPAHDVWRCFAAACSNCRSGGRMRRSALIAAGRRAAPARRPLSIRSRSGAAALARWDEAAARTAVRCVRTPTSLDAHVRAGRRPCSAAGNRRRRPRPTARAWRCKADDPGALGNLGAVLREMGRSSRRRSSCSRRAARIEPTAALALRSISASRSANGAISRRPNRVLRAVLAREPGQCRRRVQSRQCAARPRPPARGDRRTIGVAARAAPGSCRGAQQSRQRCTRSSATFARPWPRSRPPCAPGPIIWPR